MSAYEHFDYKNKIKELLDTARKRLDNDDYGGSIDASRSALEQLFAAIYFKVTEEELTKGGSLKDGYRKIKNLLVLSESGFNNSKIKGIMSSITSLIDNMDDICNNMGDRHLQPAKPNKHHAKLCLDMTEALCKFFI